MLIVEDEAARMSRWSTSACRGSKATSARALEAGFDLQFTKPVTCEELVRAFSSAG